MTGAADFQSFVGNKLVGGLKMKIGEVKASGKGLFSRHDILGIRKCCGVVINDMKLGIREGERR